MRINPQPKTRGHADGLLPLIDVVCVLLIFFLIAARMAPAAPFAVDLPRVAAGDETRSTMALFLSPTGQPGFRRMVGDVALAELARARETFCAATDCAAEPPLVAVHTDQKTPAVALTRIMPQLAAMGFQRVELVTDGRGA
ncbi:ExbD/TolR family protein [Neogemmobacter tilapiae]|uniref:Biopolymer transporter ExbD n=1 Tax=Neogemmobacter tilapiae TaxID=875041 RepID=A0A918TTW1_9RHOB|nr:biopolymer transporter ExbD [Gemmobacter tilapiae]GHC63338.1 hypothetical protein GCM10007315_29460 [Gemmobacter tilapiae]